MQFYLPCNLSLRTIYLLIMVNKKLAACSGGPGRMHILWSQASWWLSHTLVFLGRSYCEILKLYCSPAVAADYNRNNAEMFRKFTIVCSCVTNRSYKKYCFIFTLNRQWHFFLPDQGCSPSIIFYFFIL